MKKEAVIDNVSLSYFSDLNELMARHYPEARFDVFQRLRYLFAGIHVSQQVVSEFERVAERFRSRRDVVSLVKGDRNCLILCKRYDTMTHAVLNTSEYQGIHAGEAEAISQAMRIGIRLFITDDIACVEAMNKTRFSIVRCVDSLCILAMLDLQGYLAETERDRVFGTFLSRYQRPKGVSIPTQLRNAYKKAAEDYRLDLDKKELSQKSSVKRLKPYIVGR